MNAAFTVVEEGDVTGETEHRCSDQERPGPAAGGSAGGGQRDEDRRAQWFGDNLDGLARRGDCPPVGDDSDAEGDEQRRVERVEHRSLSRR